MSADTRMFAVEVGHDGEIVGPFTGDPKAAMAFAEKWSKALKSGYAVTTIASPEAFEADHKEDL